MHRHHRSSLLRILVALVVAITGASAARAQTVPSPAKQLTVERIHSGPSLNGELVEGMQWSPDGKRVSFFQTTGEGASAKTELGAVDAANGEKHILVDAAKLATLLQPEKGQPTQATGLGRVAPENYIWSSDSNELLFKSGGRLVWLDLRTMFTKTLVSGGNEVQDPKFSPDGRWVTFVRDSNLWIANVMNGELKPLTRGGSEEILKGQLDWVYPEELDLGTAYWWSPDSQQIAFLEFDERPVTKYPIIDLNTGGVESTRFPQAGEANPIARVGVVPLTGGEPKWMDTGKDTDVYLARVDWVPDSKHLAIQRLNRAQTKLELLLADAATGASRTVLTETDNYWINLSDESLRFFADGRRFLWTSERTGFRHLYLYDIDGKLLGQLTHGDWEVTGIEGFGPGGGNSFALDERHGYVYFISNKDNAVERHLYRLSLADKSVSRVTGEAGTHEVMIAPDAGAFVDTFSNAMTPPRQDLYRIDGTRVTVINEDRVPELPAYHLSPVEFLSVRAGDGTLLHALMIKPPDFDPSRKYPVLVYVYGGPHAQEVRNAWDEHYFLWHQLMAQKGYIIFKLDNRGSYGRGHNFETPLYHHFGKIELVDQLAGVSYLKSLPYVDPARIGIWGWSYGGFMTLTAMFDAPQIFKAGVAAAPVTDWRLYDTIYTERYMARPQENADGYRDSSPVSHSSQLRGKLMIIHGTGDDNVHFANTAELLSRFIEEGRYPEIMIFPGRGHPINDAPASILLFNRMTKFLLDNL
ncbi:MAG: S9 family peptidase [Candidatus Acidiferrales bacterium]